MMKGSLHLLLLAVCCVSYVKSQNYCNPNLCPRGQHIACGNNGAFGRSCPRNARVINLSRFQSLILQMHNVRRNRVAGGNLSGYQTAARMPTILWDNELARIALLNARRCFMQHDTCRNTPRFIRSGQNIGQTSTRGIPNRLRRHLISVIQGWFTEYRDANMNIINSFSNPRTVGHFTLMVTDRINRMGCGTVGYVRNGRNYLLTTCNYASTNIFNRPVYATGAAASGCTTGTNARYPNLCSPSEPVNPNTI